MHTREQILNLIREKVHHPASARELTQILRVPREDRVSFKRQLKHLVSGGDLIQIRGNRYGLADKMDLVVGRLQTHPNGFGFVVPERTAEAGGDVFIASTNLKDAVHGDRVVVRIEHRRDDARVEGRIVKILERGNATLVGRYEADQQGFGFVVPFDRRVLHDVQIPRGEHRGAKGGEMVTVELTRWPSPTRGPAGRVIEVLGNLTTPGVDTTIMIRKYGIPDQHGDEAVEEARRMTGAVVRPGFPPSHEASADRRSLGGAGSRTTKTPSADAARQMHARPQDTAGRTDFRGWPTVTIDGEHARDFDDAISLERLPNGNYWLGVHIADVSHYVGEDSALDSEAYERSTSVYFPDRAVHMFPEELSTGLCSLNPGVDRLTQSAIMEVNRHGEIVRYELHDGVINCDARMTYTAVNAILTDRDPELMRRYYRLVPMFERMRELYEILNERRHRRGAVDLDLQEPELVMDEGGEVEAIIALERNVAHRLIEEFMLLANETVATHLEEAGAPSLYRIHEQPDPLKVERFEEFLTTLGYSLGAPPHAVQPRHFQRLLEKLQERPEEKPVAALLLRTMQKARYAAENVGHFGLAAASYTHFTSPIRRYPDLVVHRVLRELRRDELTTERAEELREDLPEVARHTSDRERRANDAERELLQWKKVRFMADKVGDEFEGYVTGVNAFGLFVQLIEHLVEGLVHVSTMADDYYRFLEATHSLRGENTKKVYRLGDRVKVQVLRVDQERKQIDFGLVQILEQVRREEQRRQSRRSHVRPKREQRGRHPRRRH
ncbi:MAG: ribonuclease R [Acidobacteria bacterium]|nr:ribonuclease R [Acidobacteriota bacterium]